MAFDLPDFDPDAFRSAIQFVMQMGAPVEEDKRATFFMPVVTTSTGPADSGGVPFGPDAVVNVSTPVKHQAPVAVVYKRATTDDTPVGEFAPDYIVITLLDVDYATVEGFEYLVLDGQRFNFAKEYPRSALGSVGVHQIECKGVA
jgi:hypothetical protein